MHFPTVMGRNLENEAMTIPFDLSGEFNAVILAFSLAQQFETHSWLPHFEKADRLYPNFAQYQLPIYDEMGENERMLARLTMRRQTQNWSYRPSVIPLFVNKARFCQRLHIHSQNSITVLLLDREGEVLWRQRGYATFDKRNQFWQALETATLDRITDS